jgi:hypothetical protein
VVYLLDMTKARVVCLRVLAALAVLVVSAWAIAYAGQWLLRWRAERLLGEIRSLQVNRSTLAEVKPLIAKWSKTQEVSTDCTAEDCQYGVTLTDVLPAPLRGYPDDGVKNYLPRLMDHIGLRSASAVGGIRVRNGVVTERTFIENVSLPVSVWFERGGAFVPDLLVWSSEISSFRGYDFTPLYPHRVARNLKGPYGVKITFVPEEQADVQKALMDFRLHCITRFSPCLEESEILPESSKLLEETRALRRAANDAMKDK